MTSASEKTFETSVQNIILFSKSTPEMVLTSENITKQYLKSCLNGYKRNVQQ